MNGGGGDIDCLVAELSAMQLQADLHRRRVIVERRAQVGQEVQHKYVFLEACKSWFLIALILCVIGALILAVCSVNQYMIEQHAKYSVAGVTSTELTTTRSIPVLGPLHANDCARYDWTSPPTTAALVRLQHFCINLDPKLLAMAREDTQKVNDEYLKLRERMSGWDWNDGTDNDQQQQGTQNGKRIKRSPPVSFRQRYSYFYRNRQPFYDERHFRFSSPKSSKNGPNETPTCPLERVTCDANDIYRRLSGRCNNVEKSAYGKHSVPLTRMLPAVYNDGQGALRTLDSRRDRRLPNPRIVSTLVHDDVSHPDGRHTLALMQWGQFLAHDVSMTPKITGPDNAKLKCNSCQSFNQTEDVLSPCSPIPIPKGDNFFPSRDLESGKRKCIPFTRSLAAPNTKSQREQLNVLTAFVDSSNVYGSNECKNRDLRLFVGGRLKVIQHPMSPMFKPLMPRTTVNQECTSPTGKCFFAGEERNSEQPGLTSLHTLLMREHNRLADHLALENPHWNDEKLFQEARKIVIAINQHITYNEFLPRVLGPDLVERFDLTSGGGGHTYDDKCSPDVSNEFATAAFRFGHSLIRPEFHLKSKEAAATAAVRRRDVAEGDGGKRSMEKSKQQQHLYSSETDGEIPLKNHFFNPDVLFQPQVVDRLMRGVLSTPMETFDSHISKGLTNHLFEVPGIPFSGMDLAAINIQRGRDHGLQGYVQYLKLTSKQCYPDKKGVGRVHGFDNLARVMGSEPAARKLSRVYRNVDDIDLFTGGLSEPSLSGGVVGPTFGCIIAQQFQRLKRCDRFWHETSDTNIGFTPDQLDQIKQTTLASMLCRNLDDPSAVQRSAFDLPSERDNPVQDCNHFGTLDLTFWREKKASDGQRQQRLLSGAKETRKSCSYNGLAIPMGSQKRVLSCTLCQCTNEKVSCQTAVVENCDALQSQYGTAAVLADPACREPCPEPFNRYEYPYQVELNITAV